MDSKMDRAKWSSFEPAQKLISEVDNKIAEANKAIGKADEAKPAAAAAKPAAPGIPEGKYTFQ